ncbi:MAG: hypothetical protein BGO78_06960 [Chloroflexi bacterium 44-23]|nr:MAG: hypothetical protein BGO78_06960 [Chloroflexi bacterium 44-23]
MDKFAGFSGKMDGDTPIPSAFFSELMPHIDHLGELKVTLFAIWFLSQQEGKLRSMRFNHFLTDQALMVGLNQSKEYLIESLEKACQRASLLVYQAENTTFEEAIFFINTPKGRAALQALQKGVWSQDDQDQAVMSTTTQRPNIFKLYEDNIGPLTPLMAETLEETEQIYPQDWIEQAIQIAVENNVRRWRYVEAILKSWKERGRDEKNRRDAEKDPRRFIDDEFGQFIQH